MAKRTPKAPATPTPEPTFHDRLNSGGYRNELPYPPYRASGPEAEAARKAWNQEESNIYNRFRRDIEVEYEMDTMPEAVRDSVWSEAWEHGHASGYSEVACYYSDFAEVARVTWKSAHEFYTANWTR